MTKRGCSNATFVCIAPADKKSRRMSDTAFKGAGWAGLLMRQPTKNPGYSRTPLLGAGWAGFINAPADKQSRL